MLWLLLAWLATALFVVWFALLSIPFPPFSTLDFLLYGVRSDPVPDHSELALDNSPLPVIAWATAAWYPHLVNSLLVCNAPHPFAIRRGMLFDEAQIRRSWYVWLFQLPLLPEWVFGKDECEIIPKIIQKDLSPRSSLPETFVTALTDGPRRKGSLTAMVNYYRNAFTPASLLMQLPLVECPVSILWGERDHALGRDLAEASAAYVKNRSTRCRIYYARDASHWLQLDHPHFVMHRLARFLQQVSDGAFDSGSGPPTDAAAASS